MTDFYEFPKIARYSREVIVTEKIDGTNASIFIGEDGEFLTGSRTRWITPESDNYGFARWAQEYKNELLTLGPGRHFGEWWGSGIQRGYGLLKGEKRFSLFNVVRWCLCDQIPRQLPSGDRTAIIKMQDILPACVGLVPVLWRGLFDNLVDIGRLLQYLQATGSLASPGFMRPEGIVIFHTAGNVGFKKTFDKDGEPKSIAKKGGDHENSNISEGQ